MAVHKASNAEEDFVREALGGRFHVLAIDVEDPQEEIGRVAIDRNI